MTPAEIKSRIFSKLYNQEDGILRRYNAPANLTESRQRDEINFMVEDIASEVPGRMTPEGVDDLMGRMHQALRKKHVGRNWPTIGQFVTAIRDALGQDAAERIANATQDVDANYGLALDYFKQNGGPCPWMNRTDITDRLLAAGALTSLAEARTLGFHMTADQNNLAKQERMSMTCWKKHVRVMSKLTGRSEVNTEAIEARSISKDHLPQEILNRSRESFD